ncbi:MAG: hypothetical protein ACTHY0_02235 [Mammaliicoccus vitulinus]
MKPIEKSDLTSFSFVNEAIYEIEDNGSTTDNRKFKALLNDKEVIGLINVKTSEITKIRYE